VSGIVMQKTIDDALSMTKLCGAEEKDDYIWQIVKDSEV
jgi:hypothetical protein